jgi:hypothetical protein
MPKGRSKKIGPGFWFPCDLLGRISRHLSGFIIYGVVRVLGFYIHRADFISPRAPEAAPPLLDQRAFLRALYEAGQDKYGVWWPADFSSGCQRRPTECQKGSFLRPKRKKEKEPAFSDFIGFYFIHRMFGICGFYPGI